MFSKIPVSCIGLIKLKKKSFSNIDKSEVNDRNAPRPLLLSVVFVAMPNTEEYLLERSIKSILMQSVYNWELVLVTPPIDMDKKFQKEPRVNVYTANPEAHFYQSVNAAVENCSSDYIIVLHVGDQLHQDAISVFSSYYVQYQLAELIVSDEDFLDNKGKRKKPFFKPDFNPDYLSSFNYFSRGVIYSKRLFKELGGFNSDVNDPFHDLSLRATEVLEETQIYHISRVLFHLKQQSMEKIRRIRFDLPYPEPLISIIIPTKDQESLLRNCIDGLLNNTQYGNFEIIIVDNQSKQTNALEYLKKLDINPKINIISYNRPFNYSEMNNIAVQQAKGSIVALLNNDISIINKEWLTEMVSHACRPEIGCVGAKLYYPDGTIQHAGVILGLKGYASHAHKGFAGNSSGYFNRLIATHNVSAVTAACMVLRKEIFEAVGGFDKVNLKVAYNDIDLCLKVREAGYRNLFTPYAELIHYESKSRGKKRGWRQKWQLRKESAYFRKKWGYLLFSDPAYNKNLTLLREDFSLDLGRYEP